MLLNIALRIAITLYKNLLLTPSQNKCNVLEKLVHGDIPHLHAHLAGIKKKCYSLNTKGMLPK